MVQNKEKPTKKKKKKEKKRKKSEDLKKKMKEDYWSIRVEKLFVTSRFMAALSVMNNRHYQTLSRLS